jgi:hypothetical protein
MLQTVKKALANPEPSTHGPSRHSLFCSKSVGEADIRRRARQR